MDAGRDRTDRAGGTLFPSTQLRPVDRGLFEGDSVIQSTPNAKRQQAAVTIRSPFRVADEQRPMRNGRVQTATFDARIDAGANESRGCL